MAETDANGNLQGIQPNIQYSRQTKRSNVTASANLSIPQVKDLKEGVSGLDKAMKDLLQTMKGFANNKYAKQLADQFDDLTKKANTATAAVTRFNGASSTAQNGGSIGSPTSLARPPVNAPVAQNPLGNMGGPAGGGSSSGGGYGGGGYGGGGSGFVGGGRRGGPADDDRQAAKSFGKTASEVVSDLTGGGGITGFIGALLNGASKMYGALAGTGIQYAYNRINGPSGNQNMMLQLANALAPNVTMMRAANPTSEMTMRRMIGGLAQSSPVMGTQQDILNTILAGQDVGALMTGTSGRNGFFESVRQMQVLNPGMSPTTSSQQLAGYLGNVQAQQMGMFIGQGAFTMVGKGGRYKSLAEWAEGITKFLEQQRPGGQQGRGFTPEELISQNFPGSNINAWFQMMGVPEDLVDYWWQYVLTKKGNAPASQITSDTLKTMVNEQRGRNLGFERLQNVTQGTRREFLMGQRMYNLYNIREGADRRMNVAMQGIDVALGKMFEQSNAGRAFATLPTPIADLLMPLLTAFATSPVGGIMSAVGGIFGDPIGDPVGDYGSAGGTSTSHLSPDLAKKVNAMMRANPNLKISSGYRDTHTQNRLQRDGVGRVGPASKSAHTRGWAVDIGPTNQLGWVAKNAGRFGLQTAANAGEPWHVQSAGTMPIGDFTDELLSPFTGGWELFKGGVGLARDVVVDPALDALQGVISKFLSGGSFEKLLDHAIAAWSRLMTAPLAGLVKFFGSAEGGSTEAMQASVDRESTVKVPVVMLGGRKGFSSDSLRKTPIFDTGVGDPASLMSSQPTTVSANIGSPIMFKADITLNGVGSSSADARRVASVVVDKMQEELDRRRWLVT